MAAESRFLLRMSLLAASMMILSGCTSGGPSPDETSADLSPLIAGDFTALIYESTGSSYDIAETATLLALDGGCLGVEREDGVRYLAAFPTGTELDENEIRIEDMNPVAIGGVIEYTGYKVSLAEAADMGIDIPGACNETTEEVWLVLPR